MINPTHLSIFFASFASYAGCTCV